MKKLLLLLALLVNYVVEAQVYPMQNGSFSTCSGFFYDSGGVSGDYDNLEVYQMTFCPGTPGTYIQLDFSYFQTEGMPFDYMTVYEGVGTTGTVIGVYGDTALPCGPVASSVANGCITITFASDGSAVMGGWAAAISCSNVPGGTATAGPGNNVCSGANPFCADAGPLEFPNTSEGGCNPDAPTEVTDNTCLIQAPNPAWYFLEIGLAGDIDLLIEQTSGPNGTGIGIDVDYAIWGPFTDAADTCADFTQGNCAGDHNCSGNVVDCSFSPDPIETAYIPNAQVGQIYMVLITNFEGTPGYITMTQSNSGSSGAGTTDCSIVCPTMAGSNPTCGGNNGSILISHLDPNVPYTITYLDDGTPMSVPLTSNASGQVTISGLNAGIYSNIVTNYPGCSLAAATITLTPSSGPVLNPVTNNSPVCSLGNAVFNLFGTANATVTFNINSGGNQTTVLSAGGSATVTVNGISATTTINIISISLPGCSAPLAVSSSVSITAAATLALTSAPLTANQAVCINTAAGIAPITYVVGNGGTGAFISAGALPAGVTGIFAGGVFTISGTPTASGTFNYTVTTTGGCASANLSGAITVNIAATIALTSVAATANQTLCINTPLANITYNILTGGTGAFISAGALPAGVTGSFSGGVFTISGTPTASGTFNYTVTTTGGCASANLSGAITVNTAATIALSSAVNTDAQTLCINTPLANITYGILTGGTGAFISAGALPAGVTGSFSGGVFTISGTPTASGTFNYTVTTTGGCASANLSGAITVIPAATIALSSAVNTDAQTLCINTLIDPISYTIGNATGAIVNALPLGLTSNYTSGILTISGVPASSGEFTISITTTGGCFSATATATVSVNQDATIALTSAAITTNQTLCVNTPLANITYGVLTGGTGAFISAGALPAGVTGSFSGGVFTISGTPTQGGIFPYTVETTGGCSFASLSGMITVNLLPTAILTYSGPYCTTLATPQPATLIGTGPFTAGNFSASSGLNLNLTTGEINPSLSVPGYYIVTYLIPASGGCASIPITAGVVITEVPSAAISYNGPFCTSVNTLQPVALTGTAAYTNGHFSAPAGLSINAINGAVNPSLSAPGNYLVTYQTLALGGCASVPATTTVTINATPEITATPALQAICSEDTTNISLSSIVAGTTFTWTVVQNNVSGASDGTGNSIAQTLETITNNIGTAVYTIIPSTAFCTGNPITVTITVNPLPRPSLIGGVICRNPQTNIVMRTYTLNAGLNNADYDFVWSHNTSTITGAVDNAYVADEPGIYTVVATNVHTGCVSYPVDAAVSESEIAEVAVISGNDAFIDNPVITVTVYGTGTYEYQLDNGAFQSSNVFANANIGEHTIRVRDADDCTDIEQKFTLIGYPKFFTPNNDGYNDTWNILSLSGQSGSKISIFDRYGKLVKQISPSGTGWDGMLNGMPLPATDYWFVVEYSDQLVKKEFKAHFSLKR